MHYETDLAACEEQLKKEEKKKNAFQRKYLARGFKKLENSIRKR